MKQNKTKPNIEPEEVKAENSLPKIKPELSEEAIHERAFLTGLFKQQADEIAKEAQKRKKRREDELIELRSGEKISISSIKSIITAIRQVYEAVFPNDIPFYKHIYRLNGWTHLDPNKFVKPAIVGTWTIEMLYARLGKDIFPALSALNPALPSGIRLHKCFQFLTAEGRKKLEQYRDETIKLMEKCDDWNNFRQKLFEEYGVPYQQSLFETEG